VTWHYSKIIEGLDPMDWWEWEAKLGNKDELRPGILHSKED